MTRYGAMYGADVTYLGVPACDLGELATFADATVVILGAPFDGGTTYRPGARFGPQAIRTTDYLPHDGARPHMALRVDPLALLGVVDAGDVEMYSGDVEAAIDALAEAVAVVSAAGKIPVVLGGDHTVTLPDVTGVARAVGFGRLGVVHFDAHADTGNIRFGSLYGHGQPMRRLIESGAVDGDRFVQVGLRGYWPEPETLSWMADKQMRSYEMSEIVARGLDICLAEATDQAVAGLEGIFLSVDIDVCDPGHAPGTGTPEPGGISARALLDAVRWLGASYPVLGMDVVEVAPAYDHGEITAALANRVVLEALAGIAVRRTGLPFAPGRPLLEGR